MHVFLYLYTDLLIKKLSRPSSHVSGQRNTATSIFSNWYSAAFDKKKWNELWLGLEYVQNAEWKPKWEFLTHSLMHNLMPFEINYEIRFAVMLFQWKTQFQGKQLRLHNYDPEGTIRKSIWFDLWEHRSGILQFVIIFHLDPGPTNIFK